MKISMAVVVALAGLGLASCGGSSSSVTRMTSFVDPAYQRHTFRRIMILADTSDLQWKHALETRLTTELREHGVDAEEAYRRLPPTRNWSEQDRAQAMSAAGIDAYVTVVLTESGIHERFIPPSTVTTVTKEKKTEDKVKGKGKKDTVQYEREDETITTKSEGGYTEYTPWGKYQLKLIDAATGQVAWFGVHTLWGGPYAELEEFCDRAVAQLGLDGLVAIADD